MVELALILAFVGAIGVVLWAIGSTIAFVGIIPLFVFASIGTVTYWLGFTNFIIISWSIIIGLVIISYIKRNA
jgi:hypothetical protein